MSTDNQRAEGASSNSFSGDFALLAEAVADAFRGLSPTARLESRWSRLRECGRSFGAGC